MTNFSLIRENETFITTGIQLDYSYQIFGGDDKNISLNDNDGFILLDDTKDLKASLDLWSETYFNEKFVSFVMEGSNFIGFGNKYFFVWISRGFDHGVNYSSDVFNGEVRCYGAVNISTNIPLNILSSPKELGQYLFKKDSSLTVDKVKSWFNYSNTPLFLTDLSNIIKDFSLRLKKVREDDKTDKVHIYAQYGPKIKVKRRNLDDITMKDLDEDFYPELDIDALVSEFNSSENGLLIINGKPGRGKTKLSSIIGKKLIQERRKKFSNPEIYTIAPGNTNKEAVWEEIFEDVIDGDIIIIDDVPPRLLMRYDEDDAGIGSEVYESLLGTLDGFIASDIKIIFTTNLELDTTNDLNDRGIPLVLEDEPLYREGRLFDMLTIKDLAPETIVNILKKHGVKKPERFAYQESFGGKKGIILNTPAKIKAFLNKGKEDFTKTYIRKSKPKELVEDKS